MSPDTVGIYVHIPFCVSKCSYCDFVSYAGRQELFDEYVDAVAREIAAAARVRAATVYFGGGTPTVLGPVRLNRLLDTVMRSFDIIEGAEVSCEANPDTVDLPSLTQLHDGGFNRLSIGVQSFDDTVLDILGRSHGAWPSRLAVELARQAGFDNVGIDLIFGSPGETVDSWRGTLAEAIRLEPDHISAYGLTLEPGTPLAARIGAGEVPDPDDDVVADMMALAADALGDAGFAQYEVSNWSRSGKRCAHNVDCWRYRDYLGFGVSAHSKVGALRFANHTSLERYISASPRLWSKRLDAKDLACEATILGLRMLEGMDRTRCEGLWRDAGVDVTPTLERLASDGLVHAGQSIRLTDRGLPIANEVFRAFV